MSVKLRLRRLGRRKRPIYAVVAADERSPRDGRYIEDLGRYHPIQEPAVVTLREDRVLYWLEQGAQPTDTVRNLLRRQGLLLAFSLKRKGKTEEEIQAALEAHRAARAAKEGPVATTPAARRRQALEEERARVARQEAEVRAKAEADARARAEAQAEAERQRRAEAAAAAQAQAAQPDAEAAAEEGVEPEVKPEEKVDTAPSPEAEASATDEAAGGVEPEVKKAQRAAATAPEETAAEAEEAAGDEETRED